MYKNLANIKSTVILVISILVLLFTFCILRYTNIFAKDNIYITESTGIPGGYDDLSKTLQKIIPYQNTTNLKYVTAYQDKAINISSIHNDCLLTIAYNSLEKKEEYDQSEFLKQISNYYGENVFIVNKSFYINAHDLCVFSNDTQKYTCEENTNYNGIIYTAKRRIENITISDNKIYLIEKMLFYSIETINKIVYYKIYDNGTYKNILYTFTNNNLENENIEFTDYIYRFKDNEAIYQSKFIITPNGYNWLETRMK